MSLLTIGYLFNFIFHPFRFSTRRAKGPRLIFMSAGSGIALAALVFPFAAYLKHLLPADCWPMLLAHAFASAVPVTHASKLFLTLIVAVPLTTVLNLASVRLVRGKRASQWLSAGVRQSPLPSACTPRCPSGTERQWRSCFEERQTSRSWSCSRSSRAKSIAAGSLKCRLTSARLKRAWISCHPSPHILTKTP